MVNGDETADSYRTSAELLITKQGDRFKIINYLLKAADLYSEEQKGRAIQCLEEIHNNLKGSTVEFGMDQYFRYLHRLARSYEELHEDVTAADIYSELASDLYKLKSRLVTGKVFTSLQILKKFAAYLAKALFLYDANKKYDSILKIARVYYRVFPFLQENKSIHGELFFCYEHIIHAADMTGSRYFREYYVDLDRKLREPEAEIIEKREAVEDEQRYQPS